MNYYESTGNYLEEHKSYFTATQTKREVNFLKKALSLSKQDRILDAACGHGRHTLPLAGLGFCIEGVDSSRFLIQLARGKTQSKKIFHRQALEKLDLKKKYTKIFMLFSDFGIMKSIPIIRRLALHMEKDGLLLLDIDSVYRLQKYLRKHPGSPYRFNQRTMILTSKDEPDLHVKYYKPQQIKKILTANGFKVVATYGDYFGNKFDTASKRYIIISRFSPQI